MEDEDKQDDNPFKMRSARILEGKGHVHRQVQCHGDGYCGVVHCSYGGKCYQLLQEMGTMGKIMDKKSDHGTYLES